MKTNVLMKARRTTVKSFASLKAWMLLCLVMLCAAGVRAQTPYAIWCEGNSTLYFTNSNVTFAAGEPFYDQTITRVWYGDAVTNIGDGESPQWSATVAETCTKVVFYENFSEVKPTNLNNWFRGMKNLTEIEGLQYLNTSEATNMRRMFEDCQSLTSLDLSSFDTQKVTSMHSMFAYCSGLTSLDLSSFDTKEVTVMSLMFRSCDNLTSLDLSNFNTAKVTNMTSMFQGCSSLESLDLNDFKTDALEAMNFMFSDCQHLKTIYCNNDWDTSKVPEDFKNKVFYNSPNLVGGHGTTYEESHVGYEYARVDRDGTPGYFTDGKIYVIWCEDNATLYFAYGSSRYIQGGTHDGHAVTKYWTEDNGGSLYVAVGDDDNFLPKWSSKRMGTSSDTDTDNPDCIADKCQSVVIEPSFSGARPTSLRFWLGGFEHISSIEGLENLNTSEVTDMSSMFSGDNKLPSLDLSTFDTSKVTDMSFMFEGCSSLTSLDLSNFNTEKVEDMYGMFRDCSSLASLDLSSFNTANVINMAYMFSLCSSLLSLDLSNFDTGKLTDMKSMFQDCIALTSLDLSNFNPENVDVYNEVFSNCYNLKTIYCGNDWNTSNVQSSYNMFYNCMNLVGGNNTKFSSDHVGVDYAQPDGDSPGYFTSDLEYEIKPYAIWCKNNATFYFVNSAISYVENGVYDGQTITKVWSGEQVTETVGWMEDYARHEDMNLHDECQKIVIDESFKDVKPSNMSEWFHGFEKVTSIEGIEYLNTSEATKIDQMFYDCSGLTTIDVSNFDTNNVTDMRKMFINCNGLTNISGLENLNTSKVTDMSDMFNGCSNLTTIDLRNFDTGNVKNMSGMFRDCGSLTSISGLENLNTSNVTNMSFMFYGCSSLTVLDLSSFDVSKVEELTQMFEGCTSLETIYSKNDWNTQYPGTASTAFMFNNCTSLIGGNGTEYSPAYTNGIYANLDVNGKRGYFTSTFEYTISSAMVGTLYMDYPVNIPEADYFDAYYVKSINSEGTLYLKKVKDVIPANTGVIIFGNEGTYKMMQNSKEVPAINDNLLCGVTKATSVASLKAQHGKDIYVLSRGKDSYINFLKAGSGVKNIPANRAYLPYSSASGAKELSIVFDEEGSEATGIDNVATEKAERTGVFNLSGQRVANPQHGIYIVNGKKVFIP